MVEIDKMDIHELWYISAPVQRLVAKDGGDVNDSPRFALIIHGKQTTKFKFDSTTICHFVDILALL